VVYPTTPISARDNPDKSRERQCRRRRSNQQTGSLNVSDALQKYVPGIVVNEVTGNPFSHVEFRGFVASPVSGTPQGLAVYQNGVRVTKRSAIPSTGLIPTAGSIDRRVTNNPAFGLMRWRRVTCR